MDLHDKHSAARFTRHGWKQWNLLHPYQAHPRPKDDDADDAKFAKGESKGGGQKWSTWKPKPENPIERAKRLAGAAVKKVAKEKYDREAREWDKAYAASRKPFMGEYAGRDLHAEGIFPGKQNAGSRYGAVMFGTGDNAGRVLLREPLNHFDGYSWTFPKGHPDREEHPAVVAQRETEEETGLIPKLVGHVPGGFGGTGSMNHFYLAHDSGIPWNGERMNGETDRQVWATAEQADAMIAEGKNVQGVYRDRQVLRAAIAAHNEQFPHMAQMTTLPEVPPPPKPKVTWAPLASYSPEEAAAFDKAFSAATAKAEASGLNYKAAMRAADNARSKGKGLKGPDRSTYKGLEAGFVHHANKQPDAPPPPPPKEQHHKVKSSPGAQAAREAGYSDGLHDAQKKGMNATQARLAADQVKLQIDQASGVGREALIGKLRAYKDHATQQEAAGNRSTEAPFVRKVWGKDLHHFGNPLKQKWDHDKRPFHADHYDKLGQSDLSAEWHRGYSDVYAEDEARNATHAVLGEKVLTPADHARKALKEAAKSISKPMQVKDAKERAAIQAYHEGRAHSHHDLAQQKQTVMAGVAGLASAFRERSSAVIFVRNWKKWHEEHPYTPVGHTSAATEAAHLWGEAGAAAWKAKHPGGEKTPMPAPEKPHTEKARKEREALMKRFEAEAKTIHNYAPGSTRAKNFEQGYVAARVYAKQEHFSSEWAHGLSIEHHGLSQTMQANQARAKREGVAAGYHAHSIALGDAVPEAPETHAAKPTAAPIAAAPIAPAPTTKYLPGSPKYKAFMEGHAAAMALPSTPKPEHITVIKNNLDKMTPGTEKANTEGFLAAQEYKLANAPVKLEESKLEAPKPTTAPIGHLGPSEEAPHAPANDHDLSQMVKSSGPTGTNPAAWYADPATGTRYIVKEAKSPEHAYNEVSVNETYRQAGIHVPEVTLLKHDNGSYAVVSKEIGKPDELTPVTPQNITAADKKELRRGAGIDALTSNYDFFGLPSDPNGRNVLKTADGKVVRVDQGGGGFYRATGPKKGPGGFEVGDWNAKKGGTGVNAPDYESIPAGEQGKIGYGAVAHLGIQKGQVAKSLDEASDLNLHDLHARLTAAGVPQDFASKYTAVIESRQQHLHEQGYGAVPDFNGPESKPDSSGPPNTLPVKLLSKGDHIALNGQEVVVHNVAGPKPHNGMMNVLTKDTNGNGTDVTEMHPDFEVPLLSSGGSGVAPSDTVETGAAGVSDALKVSSLKAGDTLPSGHKIVYVEHPYGNAYKVTVASPNARPGYHEQMHFMEGTATVNQLIANHDAKDKPSSAPIAPSVPESSATVSGGPEYMVGTRLENHQGTSNKFYESLIHKLPNGHYVHTTRYGSMKPGAHVTENTKEHETYTEANAAHLKTLQMRQKHGYHLAAGGGAPANNEPGAAYGVQDWTTPQASSAPILKAPTVAELASQHPLYIGIKGQQKAAANLALDSHKLEETKQKAADLHQAAQDMFNQDHLGEAAKTEAAAQGYDEALATHPYGLQASSAAAMVAMKDIQPGDIVKTPGATNKMHVLKVDVQHDTTHLHGNVENGVQGTDLVFPNYKLMEHHGHDALPTPEPHVTGYPKTKEVGDLRPGDIVNNQTVSKIEPSGIPDVLKFTYTSGQVDFLGKNGTVEVTGHESPEPDFHSTAIDAFNIAKQHQAHPDYKTAFGNQLITTKSSDKIMAASGKDAAWIADEHNTMVKNLVKRYNEGGTPGVNESKEATAGRLGAMLSEYAGMINELQPTAKTTDPNAPTPHAVGVETAMKMHTESALSAEAIHAEANKMQGNDYVQAAAAGMHEYADSIGTPRENLPTWTLKPGIKSNIAKWVKQPNGDFKGYGPEGDLNWTYTAPGNPILPGDSSPLGAGNKFEEHLDKGSASQFEKVTSTPASSWVGVPAGTTWTTAAGSKFVKNADGSVSSLGNTKIFEKTTWYGEEAQSNEAAMMNDPNFYKMTTPPAGAPAAEGAASADNMKHPSDLMTGDIVSDPATGTPLSVSKVTKMGGAYHVTGEDPEGDSMSFITSDPQLVVDNLDEEAATPALVEPTAPPIATPSAVHPEHAEDFQSGYTKGFEYGLDMAKVGKTPTQIKAKAAPYYASAKKSLAAQDHEEHATSTGFAKGLVAAANHHIKHGAPTKKLTGNTKATVQAKNLKKGDTFLHQGVPVKLQKKSVSKSTGVVTLTSIDKTGAPVDSILPNGSVKLTKLNPNHPQYIHTPGATAPGGPVHAENITIPHNAPPATQAIGSLATAKPPADFEEAFKAAEKFTNKGKKEKLPQQSTMTDAQLEQLDAYRVARQLGETTAKAMTQEDALKQAEVHAARSKTGISPSGRAASLGLSHGFTEGAKTAITVSDTQTGKALTPDELRALPAYQAAKTEAAAAVANGDDSRTLYAKAGGYGQLDGATAKARYLAYQEAAQQVDFAENEKPTVFIDQGHAPLSDAQVADLHDKAKPSTKDSATDLQKWAYDQGRALGIDAGNAALDSQHTPADLYAAAQHHEEQAQQTSGLLQRKHLGIAKGLYRVAESKQDGKAQITTSASHVSPKPDVTYHPPGTAGYGGGSGSYPKVETTFTPKEQSAIKTWTNDYRFKTQTPFISAINKLMAGQDPGTGSDAEKARTFIQMAATKSTPSKQTIYRRTQGGEFHAGQLEAWRQAIAEGKAVDFSYPLSSATYSAGVWSGHIQYNIDPGALTVDIGPYGNHTGEKETVTGGLMEVYNITQEGSYTVLWMRQKVHYAH
jgi:8-oxo-dGTP diphosphatase